MLCQKHRHGHRIFFHPDFTVGWGISPHREHNCTKTPSHSIGIQVSIPRNKQKRFFEMIFFADYTAGMEFHQTSKTLYAIKFYCLFTENMLLITF